MMVLICCVKWPTIAAFSPVNGRFRVAAWSLANELKRHYAAKFAKNWDDIRTKTYADGRKEEIYMIYLIFDCVSANREVKINEEFQDYAWVKPEDLVHYDLNVATRKTLRLKGLL